LELLSCTESHCIPNVITGINQFTQFTPEWGCLGFDKLVFQKIQWIGEPYTYRVQKCTKVLNSTIPGHCQDRTVFFSFVCHLLKTIVDQLSALTHFFICAHLFLTLDHEGIELPDGTFKAGYFEGLHQYYFIPPSSLAFAEWSDKMYTIKLSFKLIMENFQMQFNLEE